MTTPTADQAFAGFWETEVRTVDQDTEHLELTTGQWHALYTAYCQEHGAPVPGLRQFGNLLTALGHPSGRPVTRVYEGVSNTGRMRQGITPAKPARELQGILVQHAGNRRPTADEVREHLRTQEAVPAVEFGILYGMSGRDVTVAIRDGRLGVPTFQRVPAGTHYVLSRDVVEHFRERGLNL